MVKIRPKINEIKNSKAIYLKKSMKPRGSMTRLVKLMIFSRPNQEEKSDKLPISGMRKLTSTQIYRY